MTILIEDDIVTGLEIIEAMWGQHYKGKHEAAAILFKSADNAGISREEYDQMIQDIIAGSEGETFMPKPHEILAKINGRYLRVDDSWSDWSTTKSCGKCVDGFRVAVTLNNDLRPTSTFLHWCDCDKAVKHPQYKNLPLHKMKYVEEKYIENPFSLMILDYSSCWSWDELLESLQADVACSF